MDKAGARAACGVGLGAEARGWQGPGGTAARRGDGARPPRVGAGHEGRCTRGDKKQHFYFSVRLSGVLIAVGKR